MLVLCEFLGLFLVGISTILALLLLCIKVIGTAYKTLNIKRKIMNINDNGPKKSLDDAKKEEKELKKEGNAFANTPDTRPLSKAIVKEKKKRN